MSYYAQSPFTQLSDSLFGQGATARSSGRAVNQIAASADPYFRMRSVQQPGVSRSIFDATSHLGEAAAARQAAPIEQELQDSNANAGWNLQKSNANEQFANQMWNMLAQKQLNNQRNGLSLSGLMGSLFGQ